MLRRSNPLPEWRGLLERRPGTEKTTLPQWIRPQLTRLADVAPEGDQWLHEIKFDGYRMHARLDRGNVRLLTRTGLDRTRKYSAIAAAVSSLGARQAYLDGELCCVRPDGTTSFSLIQNASDARNSDALIFFLFDLPHLDGEAMAPMPVAERKERPRRQLAGASSPLHFRRSPHRPRTSLLRRAPAARQPLRIAASAQSGALVPARDRRGGEVSDLGRGQFAAPSDVRRFVRRQTGAGGSPSHAVP
jgi:hypothetical protein